MPYAIYYFCSLIVVTIVYFSLPRLLDLSQKKNITNLLIGITLSIIFYNIEIYNFIIIDMIIIITAIVGGILVSKYIGDKNTFIIFLIVAATVDYFSFSGGLTNKIISSYNEGQSNLLNYIAVSIPQNNGFTPVVGIADIYIISIILTYLIKQNYGKLFQYFVPLVGLYTALTFGILLGGIYAIPFFSIVTIFFVIIKEP